MTFKGNFDKKISTLKDNLKYQGKNVFVGIQRRASKSCIDSW